MAEGGKKDAAYIACDVVSVVNEFCAEDAVQVIMDGANKATWPIIIKEFPRIILSWCVAHVISEDSDLYGPLKAPPVFLDREIQTQWHAARGEDRPFRISIDRW